jgi:hypothetical protein
MWQNRRDAAERDLHLSSEHISDDLGVRAISDNNNSSPAVILNNSAAMAGPVPFGGVAMLSLFGLALA